MGVKNLENEEHVKYLGETFVSVWNFNTGLNLKRCTFGVQVEKFPDFTLTNQAIEENSDKCQTIIDIKSLESVKEVQQLMGRLVALSHFLSEKVIEFPRDGGVREGICRVKMFLIGTNNPGLS